MRAMSTGGAVIFVPDEMPHKKRRGVSYRDLAKGHEKKTAQGQPLTAFAKLGRIVKKALGKEKAA